jgi:hypothetical protein
MEMIKRAGLEDKIESSIEVEENYQIKKVVGYGATSTVYKAFYFKNGDPFKQNISEIEMAKV